MFFMVLCIVFLLAYGVAAQSLLYPNAEASWHIIFNIFYNPYLSMYQEFPLDQLEGMPFHLIAVYLTASVCTGRFVTY